jgi:16S rRNA (guanine527-N7)-methyltransferase
MTFAPPSKDRIAELVEQVSAAAGVSLGDGERRALVDWVALVAETNQRTDLTAARTVEELVDLMVVDALVLADRVAEGASVVDVGTGAGAPGLPLAIARPSLALTLVEPLDKRVSFLRTAIGRTLSDRARAGRLPRVVRGRGETLVGKGRFDVALSRATLPPPEWLALGSRLAPTVWVLLAQAEPPEAPGIALVEVVRYDWPLTGVARLLARYRADATR